MQKSVVIIGKGTSVRRSTREFIDSFDEVAICNQPPYEGYEHLISDHADYHFCNATGVLDTCAIDLKIKTVFNIGGIWTADRSPSEGIVSENCEYIGDCSAKLLPYFCENYNFGTNKYETPCAGTYAFEWLLRTGKYNKIATVGLDLMEVNKEVYYFPKKHVNPSLHYLWNNGTYTNDGVRVKKSLHDHTKTLNYYKDVFELNKNIQFVIMTDSASLTELADDFGNVEVL